MKTPYKALLICALVIATCANVRAQGNDAQLAAKFRQATEAQRAGRLDEAAASYTEVVRLRPDIPEVLVNFGLVRYQQKQFESAIDLFERALARKPDLSGARLFLGISYYFVNSTLR